MSFQRIGICFLDNDILLQMLMAYLKVIFLSELLKAHSSIFSLYWIGALTDVFVQQANLWMSIFDPMWMCFENHLSLLLCMYRKCFYFFLFLWSLHWFYLYNHWYSYHNCCCGGDGDDNSSIVQYFFWHLCLWWYESICRESKYA